MKRCTKCGEEKGSTEFYQDRTRPDGLSYNCKACKRANYYNRRTKEEIHETNKRWRAANAERLSEYFKRLSQTSGRKSARTKCSKDMRAKYPEKYRARQLVNIAIKIGRIMRQPCGVCASVRSEAHHDDYSKPYEIRWLCRQHHNEHHKTQKRLAEMGQPSSDNGRAA